MFFSCVCGVLCIYNDCFKLAKLKAKFRTFQIASLIKGDGKPVLQQAARTGLEPETLERPELKASWRPKGTVIRGFFLQLATQPHCETDCGRNHACNAPSSQHVSQRKIPLRVAGK